MAEQASVGGGRGGVDHHGFVFVVDGQEYKSPEAVVTGAQIKAIAHKDPSLGLFLEGKGGRPDRQIADHETVNLAELHDPHFYTAPGATFGQ
jgi:Multiubiquitin